MKYRVHLFWYFLVWRKSDRDGVWEWEKVINRRRTRLFLNRYWAPTRSLKSWNWNSASLKVKRIPSELWWAPQFYGYRPRFFQKTRKIILVIFLKRKRKKIIKQAGDYFMVILPFRHYSFVIYRAQSTRPSCSKIYEIQTGDKK